MTAMMYVIAQMGASVSELSNTMSSNSLSGYGSTTRSKKYDSLARAVTLHGWGGPDKQPWDELKIDFMDTARIHGCREIFLGTLTRPVRTTINAKIYPKLLEEYLERNAVAVVILNKTFKSYKPAMVILQEYQGVEGGDDPADTKDVWDALEVEFVDGGKSTSTDPSELYTEYNYIKQRYDESPMMYYARKNKHRRFLDRNGREILV